MNPVGAQHTKRLARPWRIAFVLYAFVLTVATHWPHLDLTGPDGPEAPDKLLHLFAFGGLAFLLLQTRWLSRIWLAGIVAVIWTLLDEVTQSLPMLGRQSSLMDILAGELGVILVIVWMFALGPIGGVANRTRIAQQHFLLADLFRRPRTWIVVLLAALIGAVIMGSSIALAMKFISALSGGEQLTKVLVASVVGALGGTHISLAGLLARHAAERVKQQPCFGCGSSCEDVLFDESGRGRCLRCDAALQLGQWVEPMQLPLKAALRGGVPAVALGGALLVFGVQAALMVLDLSWDFAWAKYLIRTWKDFPPDMRAAVDISAIALILAMSVRLYRWRQAKLYDCQHKHCCACEHDLRGTPIAQGIGRCPECGTPFVRFAPV